MEKRYTVYITKTLEQQYNVYAENEKQARQRAIDKVRNDVEPDQEIDDFEITDVEVSNYE